MRKLPAAKAIARELGFDWQSLEISHRPNKRFSIRSPYGRTIHFGYWDSDSHSWQRSVANGTGYGTYIDHYDEAKRAAWRARFKNIRNSSGKSSVTDPESPLFYSWNILW